MWLKKLGMDDCARRGRDPFRAVRVDSMPGITWVVLMSFFAAYALIDGIARSCRRCRRNGRRIGRGACCSCEGLLGIAVAVLWWAWPVSDEPGVPVRHRDLGDPGRPARDRHPPFACAG